VLNMEEMMRREGVWIKGEAGEQPAG